MKTIEVLIKEARELKGLSLSQVSDVIKIKASILEAIENEEAQSLLPKPYLRGFILTYAGYLGIRRDFVLNKLDQKEVEGKSKNLKVKDQDNILDILNFKWDARNTSVFYVVISIFIVAGLNFIFSPKEEELSGRSITEVRQAENKKESESMGLIFE